MSRLRESLRSARKIELLILIVFVCAMLVIALSGRDTQNTDAEARMRALLSKIEGAGRVRVMLSEDAEGNCTGAVIATPGADDVRVVLELERAVRTLTGVPLDRIEIVKSTG